MLLPFFSQLEHSWMGQSIQSSVWLFPVIESIHLVGLGIIAGSVLIVDMRLLGVGLRSQSVEEVAEVLTVAWQTAAGPQASPLAHAQPT